MSELKLALPFDTDNPEFRRGVEVGLLWGYLAHQPFVEASVHDDCAEMVMRIAEARGLPFAGEPAAPGWLHITIGTPC